MPTLRGEFFFGVLGEHGYNTAALSRSESGFVHAARRIIRGGQTKAEFGPCRIRVVRPSDEMLIDAANEHAKLVRERRVSAVRDRVRRYYELVGALPASFAFTRSQSDDTFGVWRNYGKTKRVKWTGNGDICIAFPVPVEDISEDNWSESEGAPSTAEHPTGQTCVAFRGWRGGAGSKFRAHALHALHGRDLLNETPAFFFSVITEMPAMLDATIAQYHADEEAQRRSQQAGMAKIAEERAARHAREREELLRLFGPPKAKP
jgi:hypothetical protein